MDEIIGLIRDLALAVRELHKESSSGNFTARQLDHKLDHLVDRANRLLPDNPHKTGLSPERSQAEWDALVGHKP